jgi:hypothetical protein
MTRRTCWLSGSRARLGVAVLLLVVNGRAGGAGSLQVGTCSRDITPVSAALADEYQARFGAPAAVNHARRVLLAGFGNGRAATDYHDRLWARGMVVEGQGVRVAIVALDLIGYFQNEIETARALVSPASAIDYLVVASTHQHEGPDTLGLWGPSEVISGIDFGYLDFVNGAVADCVDEAARALQPARAYFAEGASAGLSLGLDPEDDGLGVGDGKVLAGDDALAPATGGRIVDPRLSVMQLTTRRHPREVLATLVSFASHPESLGSSNTVVTSDFPHFARQRLEDEFGGLAIWVSADLGVLQGPLDIDVQDPATGLPAVRRTFRFAEVYGTKLAERAIVAINAARFRTFVRHGRNFLRKRPRPGHVVPEIRFARRSPVPVRLDNPFFRFLGALRALNPRRPLYTDGIPDASVGNPFPPPFDDIPQLLAEDVHTEVGALLIGPATFAIIPSELDPQIGESYRRVMAADGAKHTFLIGLGNDHIGYQVPFAKWDDSCHACAPFILAGDEDACGIPIDCNTVFINNVGRQVDPSVSNALVPLLESLR